MVHFTRQFSGGTVASARRVLRRQGRLRPQFSGGTVNFNGAEFSGGAVGFSHAEFSGGTVDFNGAEFSGGEVDFTAPSSPAARSTSARSGDWSFPPAFPWTDTPPPGVKLPKKEDQSEA